MLASSAALTNGELPHGSCQANFTFVQVAVQSGARLAAWCIRGSRGERVHFGIPGLTFIMCRMSCLNGSSTFASGVAGSNWPLLYASSCTAAPASVSQQRGGHCQNARYGDGCIAKRQQLHSSSASLLKQRGGYCNNTRYRDACILKQLAPVSRLTVMQAHL